MATHVLPLDEGLEVHFVDYYGDVFKVTFPDLPKEYHDALASAVTK